MKLKLSFNPNSGVSKKIHNKWLQKQLINQLGKLASLNEIAFYEKQVGYFQKSFFEKLEKIERGMNHYFPECANDKLIVLYLSEMFFEKEDLDRHQLSMKESQLYLKGSSAILEALKSANYNPFNIDSITFKVRGLEKLSLEDVGQRSLFQIRKADLRPKSYIVKGIHSILALIQLIQNNSSLFEGYAASEASYDNKKYNELRTRSVDGIVKLMYCQPLYVYMRSKFKKKKNFTDRQIKILCGRLLQLFGFINMPKKKIRSADKFYVSNFQKYLKK